MGPSEANHHGFYSLLFLPRFVWDIKAASQKIRKGRRGIYALVTGKLSVFFDALPDGHSNSFLSAFVKFVYNLSSLLELSLFAESL